MKSTDQRRGYLERTKTVDNSGRVAKISVYWGPLILSQTLRLSNMFSLIFPVYFKPLFLFIFSAFIDDLTCSFQICSSCYEQGVQPGKLP